MNAKNPAKSFQLKICKILSITLFVVPLLLIGCKDKKDSIVLTGEAATTIDAIDIFKDNYPDKSISIITRGYPLDEFTDKINADFANKTGRYDIIMQYSFSLASSVVNDYVYPLDELKKNLPDSIFEFENDLFENAWKEVGYYYKDYKNPEEGYKIVGYPFASNTMLLAYNKPMFENEENKQKFKSKFGRDLMIPTTWEQFIEVSAFFTTNETYGVCLTGVEPGNWLYYEWLNFACSNGAQIMDKTHGWESNLETPIHLSTPEIIKATDTYLQLKPYNKGGYVNVDGYTQLELFKEGNVAMCFIWTDLTYFLIDKGAEGFDERFAFAPVPGDYSMLAGGAFFINKQSRHKEDAFKFITWLLDKDHQIELYKKGACSPRKSVYDEPSVQHIPYTKALKESLDRGTYMIEAGLDADLIAQRIAKYIQKAWLEELSVKDALAKAEEEISEERRLQLSHK